MNEDDPDCEMQFCEQFFMCVMKESFLEFIVWSDDATFNGTVSQHNCVYRVTEN
jgi:hypothetical protein